ncbi:hypothetical protein IG631_08666 [Alternaria alternata]|nr:hypothetical protein IG631_08666 [Alternaria alternata]
MVPSSCSLIEDDAEALAAPDALLLVKDGLIQTPSRNYCHSVYALLNALFGA